MFVKIEKLDSNHTPEPGKFVYINTEQIVKIEGPDQNIGHPSVKLTITLTNGDTLLAAGNSALTIYTNLLK